MSFRLINQGFPIKKFSEEKDPVRGQISVEIRAFSFLITFCAVTTQNVMRDLMDAIHFYQYFIPDGMKNFQRKQRKQRKRSNFKGKPGMIKRFILTYIIFIPALTFSQTAQDSAYLKNLADSAFNLIYVNLDSARSLATEVIHLAQEKEMFSHEMDARLTLGYTWYGEYQFDKAIEIFTEGLEMAQTEKAPGIETRFINALAMVYEQKGDFRKALDYYKKGVEIDRQLNDTAGISISLGNLANAYQELGEIDTAISLQKEAILIRERRKDPKVHNNYSNLGTIYHQTGRYDLAIEYYLKGATLRDSLGEVLLEAYNYSNLAALFSKLKNHQKSIYYLEKAETIFLEGDYLRELGKNYSLRGTEYQRIGDYAKAESLFNKAIDIHDEVENHADKAVDLHNLGSVYADQNQFTQAVRYLEQSLKLKEENHQERSLTITLAELGRVLSKTGSYQRAEELLFRGQKMAIEQSNLTLQLRIAENLAEHYEKTGNIREAFSYQKRANSLKDSTFNRDYIQKLNQLYVAFETEQTRGELLEEKLKTEELEKAKAASDLKIAQRNNWLIAALGGILVLVLGGGFFFYRNKQQEKARIAEVKIEEQQKGLKAIIYAQEEERKRIAKDLHDGIVQQLGGLKLGLQKVFSAEESQEAKKMMELLDDSTQELRELSHQMMPHALSEFGLIPAIEDMLDKSLGHSEIIYQFETFGVSDQQRFEESVEISLYRIVQELINNVIKHSGASRVHIQLMKTGPNLTLIVEDNGQGFQPKSTKSGIGLMNISSRLETIDGKVNFEPSPEGGTLAIVKIPIK